LFVHVSVPLPALILSVTADVYVVTRSPLESSAHTTGWEAKTVPLVVLPGVTVKANLLTVPATVNVDVVAVESPLDVAATA
jgi:hypothetical protein